jgi:hypothetical protein
MRYTKPHRLEQSPDTGNHMCHMYTVLGGCDCCRGVVWTTRFSQLYHVRIGVWQLRHCASAHVQALLGSISIRWLLSQQLPKNQESASTFGIDKQTRYHATCMYTIRMHSVEESERVCERERERASLNEYKAHSLPVSTTMIQLRSQQECAISKISLLLAIEYTRVSRPTAPMHVNVYELALLQALVRTLQDQSRSKDLLKDSRQFGSVQADERASDRQSR